jgi:plasmid stabilization system protein ParE
MPKYRINEVLWTDRALQNSTSIKQYLLTAFSNKEVDNFYSLLSTFEFVITAFPELYPSSQVKLGVRKAVLSKVLTVYYRIKKNNIEVLAVLDSRCDISRWL